MTTLTMRRIKDDFIVTGPDIEPSRGQGLVRDPLPRFAHPRDRSGLFQAIDQGHAAERAFAPKGPRSAKMRNPAESKLGAKLEEVD